MGTSLSFLLLGLHSFLNNVDSFFLFLGLCCGFLGDLFLGLKEIGMKVLMMVFGICFFLWSFTVFVFNNKKNRGYFSLCFN